MLYARLGGFHDPVRLENELSCIARRLEMSSAARVDNPTIGNEISKFSSALDDNPGPENSLEATRPG